MIREILERLLDAEWGISKVAPAQQGILQTGRRYDKGAQKQGHLKMSDGLKLGRDDLYTLKMVASYAVDGNIMAEYHHEFYEVTIPSGESPNRFFSKLRDAITGRFEHEVFVSYVSHKTGIRFFAV